MSASRRRNSVWRSTCKWCGAMEEQLALWPEVPPTPPLVRRYDGEERRRGPRGDYRGEERRIPDPCTEQDHPEHFGAN